MADAGYFADAYEDAPAPARPGPVRVLRALLWLNAAITTLMVVAGVVAAGVSIDVVTHLVVLAAPGAVAGAVAWRITRGSSRTGRAAFAWLAVAMAWQAVRAVSELLDGDPRGFTSMLLPLSILVLAAGRPVRAYLRSPHPGTYGRGNDAGAGMVQYAGLIVLAALILGSLVALGLPSRLQSGTGSALCRIFSPGSCDTPGRRGPANADPNSANPNAVPASGDPTAKSPRKASAFFGVPLPGTCDGFFACAWKFATTDPYDIARQYPCTSVITCAAHGVSIVDGAQWNVQKAIVDDAKGIIDLAKDPTSVIDGWSYISQHPGEALRQLVWDDESAKLWDKGNYLGAIGRTAWNIGSWVIPGVDIAKVFGKAGKFSELGELAKLADKGGQLAKAARGAKQAAGRAAQAARRGDLKTARREAAEARRRADEAKNEARKQGCTAVSLAPLHIGGRFIAPLKPEPKKGPAAGTNPCEAAKAAERDAKSAENASKYHRYVQAPKQLDQDKFPGTHPVKRMTPRRGGGGLRERWKDKKGRIYEWDYETGAIEKYDKTGRHHQGEFDPRTGEQTKPPDPTRHVKP